MMIEHNFLQSRDMQNYGYVWGNCEQLGRFYKEVIPLHFKIVNIRIGSCFDFVHA
jgi:hypothetical protein